MKILNKVIAQITKDNLLSNKTILKDNNLQKIIKKIFENKEIENIEGIEGIENIKG
jgi:hypothetical protein